MGSTTQLSASVSASDAAIASQTASNAAASAAASAAEAKEMSRIATEKAAAASSAAREAAAYAAQAQQASTAAALQNGNAGVTASSNSQLPLMLVVGVALLKSNSPQPGASVLLAQRPPGKANAGLWEFPGGKVSHVFRCCKVRALIPGRGKIPSSLASALKRLAKKSMGPVCWFVWVANVWFQDQSNEINDK